MAFDALIRKGITLANKLTGSLQAEVEYRPWVDSSGKGKAIYGASQFLKAIVEPRQVLKSDKDGHEVRVQGSSVMFLQTIEPNGATDRRSEPIDPRDLIVLPDGTSSPILSVGGMTDPTTKRPYFCEVVVG